MTQAKFQVPGFMWTAVIALIPVLIQWLQGEYFSGQTWVAFAIILLGALLKFIEVYRAQVAADAQPRGLYSAPPSKARRFLLG